MKNEQQIMKQTALRHAQPSTLNPHPLSPHRAILYPLASLLVLALTAGCQNLTYSGPSGERFSRSSLGTATAVSSLSVEADTNGLRRVVLRGYSSDPNQALGTVTEAAVKAAIQGAR